MATLTLKVPFSAEDEAKMAVAAAGISSPPDSAGGGGGGVTIGSPPRTSRGNNAVAGRVRTGSGSGVGIGGAKAKLDELFLAWLAMPDTGRLFSELLADIKAGQPLTVPPHTSLVASLLRSGPGSVGSAGGSSPLRGKNSPPPRSPSRASVASTTSSVAAANALGHHFTFPQPNGTDGSQGGRGAPAMGTVLSPPSPGQGHTARSPPPGSSLLSSPGGGGVENDAGAAVSPGQAGQTVASTPAASPSTPPRPPGAGAQVAARAVSPPPPGGVATPRSPAMGPGEEIPPFYVPGVGGRGRGAAMPGENLAAKVDLIVEVFRAAAEGRPAELVAPPPAVPREGASTAGSDNNGTEEVAGSGGVHVRTVDADIALRVDQFPAVAKTLCGFPSFFAAPLFRRIKKLYGLTAEGEGDSKTESKDGGVDESDADSDEDKGQVPLRVFLRYWLDEMAGYDHVDRFFRLTRQPDARYVVKADLLPLMEELLAFHPGLAFLESTPEFQEKYARTVIARIFYKLDPLNRGCITPRALRRSNLLAAFQHVDMEEDINLVNEYFSYEHFYVLYCKFWELDTDHDFLLSRDDLDALGGHSLTKPVLDRVFAQAGRPFECTEPGKMGYEDFVCFLMSEEDKTNPVSLGYWFRIVDLDGDGVIRPAEMRHFYADQMQRMEDMNCEVVPFEDVLCQMSDLLQPDVEGEFRLKDFLDPTRVRLTGVFFSILSNLSKFTAFEQRDPFVVKQQQEPGFTAWDRYAQIEYARLAMEEDAQDDGVSLDHIEEVGGGGMMGGMGGGVGAWDDEDDDMGSGGFQGAGPEDNGPTYS